MSRFSCIGDFLHIARARMAGTFVHRVAVGQLIRLNRFSTFLYVPTHSTASEVDLCIVRLSRPSSHINTEYMF